MKKKEDVLFSSSAGANKSTPKKSHHKGYIPQYVHKETLFSIKFKTIKSPSGSRLPYYECRKLNVRHHIG